MMREVIISTMEDVKKAFTEATERGEQFACSSDAGLPFGYYRLTFLPGACFKQSNVAISEEK